MADMQVGVANIDDKGFNGMMEDKPVKASNPSLQVSVSFGKFENDSLSWEKFSAFSPNKYLEEVGKCATPGSVAQKKAYFEAHYKKIAERKAEIMDQEKQMENNSSFRSIITDQGSVEGENDGVEEGSNRQFTCEEDKHVTDIADEVSELSNDELNEETIIVKECQSSVDQLKDEVKHSLVSTKLEESALVEEKPEEVREEIPSNDGTGDTNETPMKEAKKERKHNLIKKNDGTSTKGSLKPNHVTTKKNVTSRKTPPTNETKSMIKATRKPAASQVFSSPRMYKQPASLSTSQSSALLRNKQTVPKSLHTSLSLEPPTSDSTARTSARKSLIMERMGDKDIVKRAFKSFQKSFDGQNTALKQNPTKTTSITSVVTRQKENGRPTKASSITNNTHQSSSRGLRSNVTTAEKQQKELSKSGARPTEKNLKAGVIEAKTRRDSLNPKAKTIQGYIPMRTLPKGSLDKV